MTDEKVFQRVPGAEATEIVAAYGQAVDLARRVRVTLVAAGVDATVVQVVASLTDTSAR